MRTGTTSLHVALEILLGGKCYHMKTVAENPRQHIPFWINACKEEPSDEEFLNFFKDYSAAVDFPPVAFYERLMRLYPDAKVVLSVRDPEKWFISVNSTIAKVLKKMTSFPSNFIFSFILRQPFAEMVRLLFEKGFQFDMTRHFSNREVMIKAYNDHVQRVKSTVPQDRLLVFQATDGWKPLCEFLGVPVPEQAYPRLNTSEDFQFNVKKFMDPVKFVVLAISVVVFAVVFSFLGFSTYFLHKD